MWCRNLHARERRLIGQNLQLCLNPLVPVLQLLRAEGGNSGLQPPAGPAQQPERGMVRPPA